jgi:hypothetical protein
MTNHQFLFSSAEKDDILVRLLSKNTHLIKFMIINLLADEEEVSKTVNAVTKLNRFRQGVHVIKQETCTERRQKLFTATLLSHLVCHRPTYRYLLLKENFDLLKQSPSAIEAMLMKEWYEIEKKKRSVENRMRDRGVAIPMIPREDEIHDDDNERNVRKSKRLRTPL